MDSVTKFDWRSFNQEGPARTALRLSLLAICLGLLIPVWPSLKAAAALSIDDSRYIEILAAPLISLCLVYWDRRQIFSEARFSPRVGIPLFSFGLLLCGFAAVRQAAGDHGTALALVIFSLIFVWQAAFVLSNGLRSFQAAIYPACCLWLAVPLPTQVVDRISEAYQSGSAAVSYALLSLAGVSVLRQGMTFSIPGLDFNIAPECSGIRSGLAFLLVALVAGRLYLRSGWLRLALILSTLPIAVFKNAIRIVVTTSLGAYVDRSFIDGPFHHEYGGLVFAPVDFLLFVPLLIALQKIEARVWDRPPAPSIAASALAE